MEPSQPWLHYILREELTMKIGGKEIKGLCIETLVLPREDGDIVIRAQALLDFDEFDKLCPEPKAPVRLTKKGKEPHLEDETYRQMLATHNAQRIAYMVIVALEPSNIEWDTVDINDPKTWMNYSEDFKKAGVSDIEVGHVVSTVMQANALDESKLEQARDLFLRGQRMEVEESSGPLTEPQSLPSGEPAVD